MFDFGFQVIVCSYQKIVRDKKQGVWKIDLSDGLVHIQVKLREVSS
jgi:hypothetical protein